MISFWGFIVKLNEFMVITLVLIWIFDAKLHVGESETKDFQVFEVYERNRG